MSWDETLKLSRADESKEFKIFQALVRGEITVQDAVQWTTETTMDRLESSSPGSTIEKADAITFTAILELAMRIDTAQYKPLVEFLRELKLYNAVDSSTGLVLKMQDGSRVWSHLPSLTIMARQIWTDHECGQLLCNPDMESDHQIRWAKFNIFLAQVTQAADVDYSSTLQVWISDAMDESHIGLCGLRHVFEESITPKQLVSTAGLLGVCYWFICAGERLWENVLNYRKYNKYDGRPGEKYSERNWRGFERERWDVWVQGLRDVEGCCPPDQELLKDLIERALSTTERVTNNEKQSS